MWQHDTIVSIASPIGIGGVGVVRVSGNKSLSISKKFIRKKALKARYIYYTNIVDPESKEVIDDGCIVYFKPPFSYTGEETVEFQIHSNPFILKKLVSKLIQYGARQALKGEFTKRAFINGKLNLNQVETLSDIIHCDSQKNHEVALSRLKGTIYNFIKSVRLESITYLEHIEGSINFPDEVPAVNKKDLLKKLTLYKDRLSNIIAIQDYGKVVRAGVKCVLVGRPNVGKSSLLNELLGEERAIVSDIPGTTRDFLSATIELDGVNFEIFDTAGVRSSVDKIEEYGVEKSKELIESADIIIWLVNGAELFLKEDESLWSLIKNKTAKLVVQTKSDIKQILDDNTIEQLVGHAVQKISIKNSDSIAEFKQQLLKTFSQYYPSPELDLLCNMRQINCIKNIKNDVEHCISSLSAGFEDDLLAIDLKTIIQNCGELTGEEISEEVLDGIFDKFCVGK